MAFVGASEANSTIQIITDFTPNIRIFEIFKLKLALWMLHAVHGMDSLSKVWESSRLLKLLHISTSVFKYFSHPYNYISVILCRMVGICINNIYLAWKQLLQIIARSLKNYIYLCLCDYYFSLRKSGGRMTRQWNVSHRRGESWTWQDNYCDRLLQAVLQFTFESCII